MINSGVRDRLLNDFAGIYGDNSEVRVFFAGGRVNLIGEHIDYNGGRVLPCGLGLGTYLAIRVRADDKIILNSQNATEGWQSYPLAVLSTLGERGQSLGCGLELLYYGNLPIASGLSSSASIEVVTLFALNQMFNLGLSAMDMARLGQRAENEYIGLKSGILDQFAVAAAREGMAVCLDTITLDYSYVPFDTGDYELLIFDTKKPRELASSKYNERYNECQTAAGQLGVKQLCSLTMDELNNKKHLLSSELLYRRARHAVSENIRTRGAVEALKEGDLKLFGRLMNESHASLRDDYQVSCPELDSVCNSLYNQQGVLGARMTGAGFGGCAIALVKRDRADEIVLKTLSDYSQSSAIKGECYRASIMGMPKEL